MKFAIVIAVPLLLLGLGATTAARAFCEIAESPSALPTQVNGTQVEILLMEGYARVVILKEFYNPSPVFKEGQIIFPLERGHELITDLRLRVGNVTYESSTVDRDQGLEEFLESIRNEDEAALVQYDAARDVYWIAVTIPPFQARTTITTLEMPLSSWDGFYEYGYRLAVDAGHSLNYLRVHVRVETAAPLAEVGSPSHPALSFVRQGDRAADAYVNSSATAESRNLVVRFGTDGPSVSQSPGTEGYRYVRWSASVDNDPFVASQRPAPRAMLLLVDGSGSMGLSGRWNLVRGTVRALAGNLQEGERFALAVFHGRNVVPFADSLDPWSETMASAVDEFLSTIRPHGSTNLATPLDLLERWAEEAASDGLQPAVFLISDGHTTSGPSGFDLINAYSRIADEVSLPVFAIAAAPLVHEHENVLYNLSHFHGGNLATVTADGIDETSRSLLAGLRVPVLKDVSVEFPGAPEVADIVTSAHSVRRGGEIVALARLREASSDPISIRVSWGDGTGGLHSLEDSIPGEDIPVRTLVERQWALARIHVLLARLRASDVAVETELRSLATTYRVATPYTSFLVTLGKADESSLGGSASLALPFIGGPTLLDREAQKAAGYRRDLGSALVVEDEIDRYVRESSQEYHDLASRLRNPVYDGTFLEVYDVDGELIGIQRGWLDIITPTPQGIALALAGLSASAIYILERHRRREGELAP